MADFLASFNFGATEDEPVRDEACSSIDEVLSRFNDAFDGKITETRAQRIKLSVDIGPSTQFTVFAGQGDNVDPNLSTVSARQALVSQPQEIPVLQRAVSQEILNSIGGIDGSTWSAVEENRNAQGWVMTFACNHSWQQWTRHGKAAQMQAILDYSQKEMDLVSRARPAFDCGGSVTVSFSKGNSAITVYYSHIPIHRTVGEVFDLFKPPPRPPRAISRKKAAGSAKKGGTPRKKRAATNADGEPAPKKPRSRPKKGAKNQLSQAELVPITEGFVSNVANGTTAIDAADQVALAALSAATAAEALPNAGTKATTTKHSTASLNVSPEEAERRRETAIKKLTEAGIDPATLNDDQFSIFSNQSPEVQAESLNMLVKYGAERLHIVNPTKKGSSRPAPSQPDAQTIASGAVNPSHLEHDSPSESAGIDVSVAEATEPSEKPRKGGRKGTKSRVFCFNCKLSKSKCSKDKPTCTVCQQSDLTCEYPVPKPRPRKSAALVTEDDDTIMSETADAEGEVENSQLEDAQTSGVVDAQEAVQTEEATATEVETHQQSLAYSQVPIANMMEITPDDEGNGSRPMGDASIQPSAYENPAPTSSVSWNSGGLALPQGRVYYPDTTTTVRELPPNNNGSVVEATATRRSQRPPKPSAKAKSRVPTPAQALLASPPRERHESPLERHNPRRHEAQPRNPLTFDRSSANPYGQPAAQSQYASDPYRQSASYGQSQGAYPQLQDGATERIAYDPHAYRNSTHAAPARTFGQQEPSPPVPANAAKPSWPTRGRDVSAADTLQRTQSYTGGSNTSSNTGNTMVSVYPQSQRHSRGGHGNGGGEHGVMSEAQRSGAARKSYPSQPAHQPTQQQQQHHQYQQQQYDQPQHNRQQQQQQQQPRQPHHNHQATVAPNQTQHGQQQSWYGYNGLHGSSTTTTHSSNGWGGSGGNGWN